MPYLLILKKRQHFNCRVLQFIGGALWVNSLPACVVIAFANILDPDQARQYVGPDLDPNCLLLLMAFLED